LFSRKSRLLIPRFPLAAIRREENITNDEGSITVGEPTYTAFVLPYCTLQPISGYTQSLLPEGLKDKVVYRLFCSEKVRTAQEATVQYADLVSDGKNVYYFHRVSPWQNGIINHYDTIIIKSDEFKYPSDFDIDSSLDQDLTSDYSYEDWESLWLSGSVED